MFIPIEKIIVKDRIRKDFGDIQELAEDIKKNGLINPPVINKDYELLAGERRLRACKSLGWEQMPVNMMDTRDALHDLEVEISENETRKDFSRTERESIYTRKVEMKMQVSGVNLPRKKVEEDVAKEMGTSRTNMQHEKFIIEHKNMVSVEDFSDWDDGQLSTNKLYVETKRKLAEKDRKIKELESREPEVKTVVKEVVPDDYEDLKEQAKMADIHKKDFQHMRKAYDEMADKWKKSESEKQKLIDKAKKPEEENEERLKISAFSFCSGMSNFLEKYGGYEYLMSEIDVLPDNQRKAVYDGIRAIYRWADEMLNVGVAEVIE